MKQLISLLFLMLIVGLGSDSEAANYASPNIVLIFIDDMGYADIGPFGNTEVKTPNLDRFATEGMKFTSFYATPVCSMSRACLMTGCYNARVSVPGVLFPRDNVGLNPSEVTLAEIVKQKNYATCAIGKWHLGHHPEFLPLRQGFDRYFGLPYSNDMLAGRNGMPPLPLYDNDKVIEAEPDQSQLTKRYTEKAIEFICQNQNTPFFVYLPHTMIHFPLAASASFLGKSKMGLIGDTIEEIDWSVGQIMGTLKELNLDDNTLVVFTSDNGPARREAPPFRGNKGTIFEGGVREPCMMRWPGKIPAGTTCHEIAGNIDMLPTFAKLVGATLPKDRILDGRDITSLMYDPKSGPVRDTHLYFSGLKLGAIRQGKWKYFPSSAAGNAGNNKTKETKAALYDLSTDLGESNNVAEANPDVVMKLEQELKTRREEIEANKRPVGRHAD
jgi:arylsulfatase A